MSTEQLENLVKAKQLKKEAPDQGQFDGMIRSARIRLADIEAKGLSEVGIFSSAYGAAHSLAVAALRWNGYRPVNRYIAFQCLQHTVGLERSQCRLLSRCHDIRNQAEYEGVLNIAPQLLAEMQETTIELLGVVEAMGPVKKP